MPNRKFFPNHLFAHGVSVALSLLTLAIFSLLPAASRPGGTASASYALQDHPPVQGPFSSKSALPSVFSGSLQDLPQISGPGDTITPLRYTPGSSPKGALPGLSTWADPVAQKTQGYGQMPGPLTSFAGLDFLNFGSGWPPDPNGDVGPTHYIQSVNDSVAIFNKTSGLRLVALRLNDFFTGPVGTPCDTNNRGDPVVLYDPLVDRWLVSDFAWFASTGPFYECIAVSKTGDPVSGGWYFYALRADSGIFTGYLNDYPKLGVWADGWYMSANMFQETYPQTGFGVRVWALDRDSMINGGALNEVHFDCTADECASLLPANLRFSSPPSGAPEYFTALSIPDQLLLWKFHVDWNTPANSTFTGPQHLKVAGFAIAPSIPQPGISVRLDSLSFRPMMQLQYSRIKGVESLWVNHTVASQKVAAIRWYEIRDLGGSPVIYQQGTYQPDLSYRWMGSLAVDQDGNLAMGYSLASEDIFPSIRYAGRLAGEAPGLLPQAENTLISGRGVQTVIGSSGVGRWGDYSAMSIDPVDHCTFWYTNEYYAQTGNNWQTQIASFKYPSCGQAKGVITGKVRDARTGISLANAPVIAHSSVLTLTAVTSVTGVYTITVPGGTYSLSAGPLFPGYVKTVTSISVDVNPGATTTQDIPLTPQPHLVPSTTRLEDTSSNSNHNGFIEPGEQQVLLLEGLQNNGAITATQLTAHLESLTAGVTVQSADSTYPDIHAGQVMTNTLPFVISLKNNLPCGTDLHLQESVTGNGLSDTFDLTLNASIRLPRAILFEDNFENGVDGWLTGGVPNQWALTDQQAHSPTHSWADSPEGNYANQSITTLRSPLFDLTGKRRVQITGWYKFALEGGYDFVYLDYSLDGGKTWSSDAQALATFNGVQDTFKALTVDAPQLDGQSTVALRYRLVSDTSVTLDGFYLDDFSLSYEPFLCQYGASIPPDAPRLVSPANGATTYSPVTFQWEDPGIAGLPSGYILTIDETLAFTLTTSLTTTTLPLPAGLHTWKVSAFNPAGVSPASEQRTLEVLNQLFFPFVSQMCQPVGTVRPLTFSICTQTLYSPSQVATK